MESPAEIIEEGSYTTLVFYTLQEMIAFFFWRNESPLKRFTGVDKLDIRIKRGVYNNIEKVELVFDTEELKSMDLIF